MMLSFGRVRIKGTVGWEAFPQSVSVCDMKGNYFKGEKLNMYYVSIDICSFLHWTLLSLSLAVIGILKTRAVWQRM